MNGERGKQMLSIDANRIPTMPVRRWIGAALGVVLLLAGGCAGEWKTDRQLARERANGYIAAHPDLGSNVAAAIRGLELFEGMTPAQVTASWGKPAVIQKSLNGTSELWYFPCEYPHFCAGMGGSTRRRGSSGGSEEDRYQSRAFFVDGRLAEWQT